MRETRSGDFSDNRFSHDSLLLVFTWLVNLGRKIHTYRHVYGSFNLLERQVDFFFVFSTKLNVTRRAWHGLLSGLFRSSK